jgi:hypothetical protein
MNYKMSSNFKWFNKIFVMMLKQVTERRMVVPFDESTFNLLYSKKKKKKKTINLLCQLVKLILLFLINLTF